MKPHAIQIFISENKRLHKNFNVSKSVLVLMEENPFIGASPDSNVDCSCCGSGLLELKSSTSIKREKPSHKKKVKKNEKIILKQNHPFFYQAQGQMGVTGKIIVISSFIHPLEFIRKEFCSIQKFGKIFFKHCNSFGTNI